MANKKVEQTKKPEEEQKKSVKKGSTKGDPVVSLESY